MKIRELKSVNVRLYRAIMRSRLWWYHDGFDIYERRGDKTISGEEIGNLGVNDLFDLFTDDQILRNTMGLGKVGLAQLKELA